MKITKIEISKFRSYEKITINLNNVTALVGQNNSGKSGIFRALNAFFNFEDEKISFLQDKHLYKTRTIPIIDITFSNIPEKDIYNNKLIGEELLLRFKYSHKSAKYFFKSQISNTYEPISLDFINELKKDITFVLIPVVRDYRLAQAREESILREILQFYLEKHTARMDRLSPSVNKAVSILKNNALSKISNEIKNFYDISNDLEFEITTDSGIDYSIFLDKLVIKVKENETYFDLNECGSGIQSVLIIALYRYLSKLKKQNIILGIEEPEINLHPQAIKEFIKSIHNNDSVNQSIITTHSPVVVDLLNHTDIVHFRKYKNQSRGVITKTTQLKKDFWERNDLNEIKYLKFYKYKNSEFFFANFVIVTESDSDSEIIEYILEKRGVNLIRKGGAMLNLDGVGKINYPFNLFKELEIPVLYILDKDFFLPYKINNNKEQSRVNGFFTFKKEYHNNSMISNLIPNEIDRNLILDLFFENHSKAQNELNKYNIVSMNINMEMDIMKSERALNLAYEKFNITEENRNSEYLLTSHKKAVKSITSLMHFLENMEYSNYPHSLKRIIKLIKEKNEG
jgi:putative ATP-dependent endonuclease of OLD family